MGVLYLMLKHVKSEKTAETNEKFCKVSEERRKKSQTDTRIKTILKARNSE